VHAAVYRGLGLQGHLLLLQLELCHIQGALGLQGLEVLWDRGPLLLLLLLLLLGLGLGLGLVWVDVLSCTTPLPEAAACDECGWLGGWSHCSFSIVSSTLLRTAVRLCEP
jgi:hypothetical protein